MTDSQVGAVDRRCRSPLPWTVARRCPAPAGASLVAFAPCAPPSGAVRVALAPSAAVLAPSLSGLSLSSPPPLRRPQQYSFGLTTFSPSGKLGQLDHAFKAVQQGALALGIRAVDGVVVATEKRLPSTLADPATVEKISRLSDGVGSCYAGLGPDSRVLVRRARRSAVQYSAVYGERAPVAQLVRDTAAVMQEFTQQGGVRPFGVSLLVAGADAAGPQLYQVDPSGAYFAWRASAIGRGAAQAKAFLEKRYSADLGLEDAVHTALLTLKEGFEGDLSGDVVEVGVVATQGPHAGAFRVLSGAEVDEYLAEVGA